MVTFSLPADLTGSIYRHWSVLQWLRSLRERLRALLSPQACITFYHNLLAERKLLHKLFFTIEPSETINYE